KAHVVTLKGLGEDEVHLSEVRLLPGAKLDLGADPVGAFSGALTLGLHGPAGEAYDLSQALSDPQGGLGIEGLEFDHTMGSFEVAVGGFGGGAKEKVKLRILPWQPGPATGKIYLD